AHSGENCWGTDLDDTYANSADSAIVSGSIQVSEDSKLNFWHWYDLESGYDHGYVEVSYDDGESWTNVTPGGTYTGSSGGWVAAEIGLTGYAGLIRVRFRITSNASTTFAGWYIDDVEVSRLTTSGVYYIDDVVDDPLPGGDGDGFAEPGETISLAVTLVGMTEETATGVTATISTVDPYTTVIQDTVSYGDIEPGAQAAGSGVFEVAFDPTTPIDVSIPLSLEVSASNGGPWWSEFHVRTYSVNTIDGVVTDLETGLPIASAQVFYIGVSSGLVVTEPDGSYRIAGLDPGTYVLRAIAPGYAESAEETVIVPPDGEGIDFALGAPVIALVPSSLEGMIPEEMDFQKTFRVENNGNVPLHYEIIEDPDSGRGEGGSDEFGYEWTDSDEPYGPAYEWIDIWTTGTRITGLGDDNNVGPFEIGFDFPFYGQNWTSFRLCANGWISFTSGSTSYDNIPLPSTGAPMNMIAPFWDDLNFYYGGSVYYSSNGIDTLVIAYYDVPHYGIGGGGPYTFEIILKATGEILFQYQSLVEPTDSATVGIQNEDGSDGLVIANDAPYLHDEMAVSIVKGIPWLEVAPPAGTVNPGESIDVVAGFDATGFLADTYTASLVVRSNDPYNDPVAMPVTLIVTEDCWDSDADGFEDAFCGGDDCDDEDPGTNPDAQETCDGADNDCDGMLPSDEEDADGDGWMICEDDCDDLDPDRNPGVLENKGAGNCADGLDNDCDSLIDDEEPDCGCFLTIMM
ncbi:carboxypeptidase regulatory-like domain-containing protein, partial [Thermodesulfobacteriota bacterium]